LVQTLPPLVDMGSVFKSEDDFVSACLTLGADRVVDLSVSEVDSLARAPKLDRGTASWLRKSIVDGQDPLGDAYCSLKSAIERRNQGAVYTPARIVAAMVEWAKERTTTPARIVDPGTGSGRFLVAAGRAFPNAELIGADLDPLATLAARAHLATAGFADRSRVFLRDYRTLQLPNIAGPTLYIGNPPYVRHHLLGCKWKSWLTAQARHLGYDASQLAGLHVYFFLATALHAQAGDLGCFITAAEWLDVNYGQLARKLFLHNLGGQSLTLIEPAALPFSDAATTAVITTFEVGTVAKSVRMKRVADANSIVPLNNGRALDRSRFETQSRWSLLSRRRREAPAGYVELGELCRVHRGQVTGANRIWIAGQHSVGLPPSVLYPAVTKARELFEAGTVLTDASALRHVIDLPVELSALDEQDRKAVERFLRRAKESGANKSYIAENRKAWWSVGLKEPAPILATYMARRPPAFVRNIAQARHINIAHGLYPRDTLPEKALLSLARYLSNSTNMADGRTYAGGLTKFEPREMERIPVPAPELLNSNVW
jgi:adenine-specific DNA-methyltransferase